MFDYIARSIVTKAKWMTGFVRPTLFINQYFSLSVIIEEFTTQNPQIVIQHNDHAGNRITSTDIVADIDDQGLGVYQLRVDQLGINPNAQAIKVIIVDQLQFGGEVDFQEQFALTETILIDYNQGCANQSIYLMWLNRFGGWDFWDFTAEKDFGTEITDSQRTQKNIYDNWPLSYNKETLQEEARIKAFETITVRSQRLTSAQADSIGDIKTSMHVLWVKDPQWLTDKVTVLVDKTSFQRFNETDQRHTISFIIRQTDDIATQSN